ncbi:multiple sugar transport system permease protein [Devosia subaequoris]|uniref:Multiple sugar transport system permease protein n=1 Tax=Devosia subaequoris TaxID=395930 RepID=A0A7W6IM92_9HYPH|nr:carbohydrate ABC transporter permease [Devosia subaequoris]MBB4051550.1 multiple sugar transport system permease protein [Devosia subaequoris]MCP1209143.1 carbohydrate ABC transporter permease [Devosia subaequoris]
MTTLAVPVARQSAPRLPRLSLVGIAFGAVMVLGAAVMLLPFAWMISTSLKTAGATFVMPPQLIPAEPTLDNYAAAFTTLPMGRFLLNSLLVSLASTVLMVLNCAMAGYAFARIPFRGRTLLFYTYLATLMVPQQVTLTPLFVLMTQLGWTNTYQALILPGSFGAFGTFLMRQFFQKLPREVEEAAFIDGAGYIRIFFGIAIHLARPALATLFIFAFMQSWNNFLWPLIITSDTQMMTLPLGLSALQGRYTTNWNVLMAGTVISTLPVLAVYVFAQKYIIRGLSHTGLK